ncbi:putative NAD(P)H dehydrogenase (quinone) [Methylophaga lonarensis MPL]|uniref:Putative NAD(P)H dehydrogenase (Quinone) n=1 Tax=Methylophaga lonarensis MPL TaxID=1286106 RepID=M7NXJ6_9GAMM|nr:NAD(P)H-dependent oxidoreductase [Methylophaga lonarensis]EMR11997.1 putative NAD(P)H dehydrogenase (quinone) [Methylophaga lonarensis MPL]
MKVLIVYCHPEAGSFNGTLKDVAIDIFESLGDSVEVSDLYGEGFEPVEKAEHYKERVQTDRFDPLSEQRSAYEKNTLPDDVQREIKRLENADLVIFQFPLWWHQQPAMLKGWFDRVFVSGLYTSRMRYDEGYFRGKRAFCSVTSGAPKSTFTENGRGGGEIETLLRSINFSLHYMGFSVLPPFLSTEIQNKGYTYMSPEQFELHLKESLKNWGDHLKNIDKVKPLNFLGWGDWDEAGNEKKA